MSATITLAEQIAELERELRMRRKVYPDRIARGFMKESAARWQVDALTAALTTLKKLECAPETMALSFDEPPPLGNQDPAQR